MGSTVSVKKSSVIKLYAKRDGTSTTWTGSRIESDQQGRTAIGYIKLK
jgi:hypothetical protein